MKKIYSKFALFCVASALTATIALESGRSQATPLYDGPGTVAAAAKEGSKIDKEQYLVEIKSTATCSAGQECMVEISIKAKADFHINDKYPTKFKLADPAPEGVAYTKVLVKREDGKFDEKSGKLPVGFTVAKPGKVRISGTLSFSVINDANALMEKVDLSTEVEVK
ncbi:MAG: hypothetical protein HY774_15470 [Acidobacteria bacterium]|nr:hypothetical protein [Acidobacteriota bacterium]